MRKDNCELKRFNKCKYKYKLSHCQEVCPNLNWGDEEACANESNIRYPRSGQACGRFAWNRVERAQPARNRCTGDAAKGAAGHRRNRLRTQRVLITPVQSDASYLQRFRQRGIAVVLLDRPSRIKDLCSVAVDDVRGGELAAAHLLEEGHERIGFVHGPLGIRQIADRRRGVIRAVKMAGLDPERAIVDIATRAQSAREGEECVEKLLSARIRPTAAFCANDLLALGLMRGLIKRGISIPGDMALVGYDDVEFASVLATPLTSIRQPKYELGRAAAELLLDEAHNPTSHQHKHIVYQPELIVRESSCS